MHEVAQLLRTTAGIKFHLADPTLVSLSPVMEEQRREAGVVSWAGSRDSGIHQTFHLLPSIFISQAHCAHVTSSGQ